MAYSTAAATWAANVNGEWSNCDQNDFRFTHMHTDYRLGQADNGAAILDVTETLEASFSNPNTHRGIERAIPSDYLGRSLDVQIEAVTDENGDPRTYAQRKSGKFWVLRIGDADTYITGKHTYVITYSMRDVIIEDEETGAQDFYWDVNGTGWAQPFTDVTATLTVDPALASTLTGYAYCYQGTPAASSRCEIEQVGTGQFDAAIKRSLGPFETMTIAVGFEPHTFAQPFVFDRPLFLERIGWIVPGLIVIYLIGVGIQRARTLRHAPGRGNIIPRYNPPPGLTPLTAAPLLGRSARKRAVAAQIIRFAVTKNITVTPDPATQKRAGTEFVITRNEDQLAQLSDAEITVFRTLFGKAEDAAQIGFNRRNTVLGKKIEKLSRSLSQGAVAAGLVVEKKPPIAAWLTVTMKWLGGLQIAAWVILLFYIDHMPGAFTLATVLALALTILGSKLNRPKLLRTAAGTEAYEHLKGLREYMRLAEEKRLAYLQSPEGALTPAEIGDPDNPDYIYALYEQLLPYAVLFNMQERWSEVLTLHAPELQPGHAVGALVGGAGALAMFAVASSSSRFMPRPERESRSGGSSWSGSSSSSSSYSGASSGGGSAGRGGGGGGGGGW